MSISYEIYYMQHKRWQIHARFDANQQEAAIEEARRLENESFEASCVIRESYNPNTGKFSESVIYSSPRLKNKPSAASITGPDQAQLGSNIRDIAARTGKKRGGGSAVGRGGNIPDGINLDAFAHKSPTNDAGVVILKVVLAFFVASLVGIAPGAFILYLLETLGSMGLIFDVSINQATILGAWAAGWAVAFFPLLRFILGKRGADQDDIEEILDMDAMVIGDDDHSETGEGEESLDDARQRMKEEGYALDDAVDDDGDDGADTDKASDETEEPPAQDKAAKPASQLEANINAVVNEALLLYGKQLERTSYLRFGAILFLAGAMETFAGKSGNHSRKQITTILSAAIRKLGASEAHAQGFAGNIEEYLLEQRYFNMYAAGRNGAENKLRGGTSANFAQAMKIWETPQEDAPGAAAGNAGQDGKSANYVAVLFTDIIDSTLQQQQKGDVWMMKIVRAHNDIVGDAVLRHQGRIIKHTGDGIMATFPRSDEAVEAALVMQDGFDKFSEMMPDFAFQVRVGISAGEPIHDKGDVFGSPVNLAARITNKAGSGEVAVSDVIRNDCQGKPFSFSEMGAFQLKGFSGNQMIFRAVRSRNKAAA